MKARRAHARSPATIHDVAAAAGVSVGTVSKSLNGTGQLREETRERVHRAAKRLNFRPNDLAQSLLRGRTFTVGLISTDRYGRFSIPLLEGIEDALANARMSVFLCNGGDDATRERRHVEQLLAKRVDGIIVTARRTDARAPLAAGRALPVLYAFAKVRDANALCLVPDDRGGGRMAAHHLIAAGRRRIAHVTGPEDFEAVRHRRDGYREALRAAGLDEPAGAVLNGSWSEAWGREAVDALLERRRPAIDAIFCGSDQIARGTADALRDRGVRVPDDVALVGFDNWSVVAAATRPALTTVDMNLHELGRQAGLRLLDMVDGRRQSGVVRLPCTLVRRDSCGARQPASHQPGGSASAAAA